MGSEGVWARIGIYSSEWRQSTAVSGGSRGHPKQRAEAAGAVRGGGVGGEGAVGGGGGVGGEGGGGGGGLGTHWRPVRTLYLQQ